MVVVVQAVLDLKNHAESMGTVSWNSVSHLVQPRRVTLAGVLHLAAIPLAEIGPMPHFSSWDGTFAVRM